jgi:REP element-mobilizing transposase RayT
MIRYLAEVSGKVCDDVGADLAECNREDDHMHRLAGYPPKAAVSSLVKLPERASRSGNCVRGAAC